MNIVFIVLGIIVTSIQSWIFFNILMKLEKRLTTVETMLSEIPPTQPTIVNKNVEDSVATGLVRGLQQMRTDDENHMKLLAMARKLQRTPLTIMNQNSAGQETIDTGGDLIPANLTKEEREVIKMFYAKE